MAGQNWRDGTRTHCDVTSGTIDSRQARILLVEADDRVLTSFPQSLSAKAAPRARGSSALRPMLQRTVTDVDAEGVTIQAGDGDSERVPATHRPSGRPEYGPPRLRQSSGGRPRAEVDRAGRLIVDSHLTLKGPPRGDRARRHGPRPQLKWRNGGHCPASRRWRSSKAATPAASWTTACANHATPAVSVSRQGQTSPRSAARVP